MARIAAAPGSSAKSGAAEQSALINADFQVSAQQVSQAAAAVRRQVALQFAGVRQGTTGVFGRAAAAAQGLAAAAQVQVVSTTGAVQQAAQGGIAAATAAVANRGEQVRGQVEGAVEVTVQTVEGQVDGVGQQVAAAVNAVPLPDLPGIDAARAYATQLLERAVGAVHDLGGRVLGFARTVLDNALQGVVSLVEHAGQMASDALADVTAALQSASQQILQGLAGLVRQAASALDRGLQTVVLPMLGQIESTVDVRLTEAEQRALDFLAANRDEHVEALAASVVPEPGAAAGQAGPTPEGSSQDPATALSDVTASAREASREVVQGFAARATTVLQGIVAALATTAAQVASSVGAGLAAVATAIARAMAALTMAMSAVGRGLADAARALVDSLSGALAAVPEAVASLVRQPAAQVAQFTGSVVDRVRSLIGQFISNFISTAGGLLGAPVAAFTPAAISPVPAGPIFKPPPALIDLLVGLIIGGLAAAIVPLLIWLVGPEVAAIIVVWIATNPFTFFLILLAIAVALLLLLYVIYRLIRRRRRPRGKRILRVTPAKLELGVGGPDLAVVATVSPGTPGVPPVTWTINPGGTVPAAMSITRTGLRARVRSGQPGHAVVLGGTTFIVRAEQIGVANDFKDSDPIMLVQVVSAAYTANPPLAAVPSAIPGAPPANTAEPNRDGIAGNTARMDATTAPAGRAVDARFRRSLGATVSGTVVTPGSSTGDVSLRISDTATGARLDETKPSTAGGAALMADMTVNAVSTQVASLTGAGPLGPYGVLNTIGFASSDALHPPLTRIVGELITRYIRNDFNIAPPNGRFNPLFQLNQAVPANRWNDQVITPFNDQNVTDGLDAIDINRFVGPGVPHLPRQTINDQLFQYASWQGAGTVVSRTFAGGVHIVSLIGPETAPKFTTEHVLGRVRAPRHTEPYIGNRLIVFSAIAAAPTAPGATALAADNTATAALTAASTVPGRTVNWSVLSGDVSIVAGNPATLPAAATLKAGPKPGNNNVRVADSVFPNRRADGRVRVVAVALRRIKATPSRVPPGVNSSTVALDADPGGRVVNWQVDAAAAAAGVAVRPASTGPGAPAQSTTVTRPAAFTGTVTVTATDSVLTTTSALIRIVFR